MKQFRFLTLGVVLAMACIFSPPTIHSALAAPDSTAVKGDSTAVQQSSTGVTSTATNSVNFGGLVNLPVWVLTILTVLASVLPTMQAVLKLIPSATPIGGILGTVLNWLTFFIKNTTTSSTTAT